MPAPSSLGGLYAIAVISDADIWVGGVDPVRNGTHNVAHWNGRSWSAFPAGDAPVNGLAAISALDIWGEAGSTMVHWDGHTWRSLPPLRLGQAGIGPRAITAIAVHDVWMVGHTIIYPAGMSQTLTAHWDGRGWRIVPSPNSSFGNGTLLEGVAALSSRDVWAVGVTIPRPQRTVIEHWDGVRWRLLPSPNGSSNDNALRGIVALSARDIWAVGLSQDAVGVGVDPRSGYDRALFEHYDGVRWTVVPSRVGGDLDAVAADSSHELWASGLNHPEDPSRSTGLLLEGDGRRWRSVALPPLAPPTELKAVAISPSKTVWAVGYDHHGALVLRRLPCPSVKRP
jgi:hypothetical protein